MDDFLDQGADGAVWAAALGLAVVALRGWRPLTKALLLGYATVTDLVGDVATAVHPRLANGRSSLSDIYERPPAGEITPATPSGGEATAGAALSRPAAAPPGEAGPTDGTPAPTRRRGSRRRADG